MLSVKGILKHNIPLSKLNTSIVKSDRINALRKQYDAFLAEDKNRKKRNEFILDRLDKMRYCTTAVLHRQKPTTHVERQNPTYNHGDYEPESSTRHDIPRSGVNQYYLPLDIPRKPLGDAHLIQEISKKYILIPKTLVNDCTQDILSNVNDNSDWKSKYEILNQLKEHEKVEPTNKHSVQDAYCRSVKIENETILNENKQIINNCELNKYVNKDESAFFKHKNELPEKGQSESKLSNESQNTQQYTDNNKYESQDLLENKSTNKSKQDDLNEFEVNNSKAIADLGYKLQNVTLDFSPESINAKQYTNDNENEEDLKPEREFEGSLTTAVSNIEEKGNSQIENDNIDIGVEYQAQIKTYEHQPHHQHMEDYKSETTDSANVAYLDENDRGSIPVISHNDLVREINNEIPVENTKQIENIEYPINIINAQEFTPNDNVILQDGININPEEHAINQPYFATTHQQGDHRVNDNNYEDTTFQNDPQSETVAEPIDNQDDASGIEAFDAEQREMFYSEQPEENYAYDQAGAGDAYNSEYAQNENYQQNEEYTYYEGGQPEQTGVAEINEHEETAQRYDQNYEEQYAAYEQEEYTQEQVYDQQQQEYEPQVYDQVQPEIDQLQYEQNYETTEHVQQQLDNEQGYVEKQNVEGSEVEKPVQEKQQVEQVADQ